MLNEKAVPYLSYPKQFCTYYIRAYMSCKKSLIFAGTNNSISILKTNIDFDIKEPFPFFVPNTILKRKYDKDLYRKL